MIGWRIRPGPDSGLGGGKQSGLLTISEDGLEFLAKKQSHLLPWSRVEMISYGRMSGDTDTKWVVLSLNPVAGQWSFIGYRDGRKFGYGGDTTRVFDAIVEGLRMSGSGPFAVPQGHSAYVTPFLQFSVALPEGWQHYSVSQTYLDGLPTSGRTIFSPLDLEQDHAAIHSGSEPAVFLDRFEAGESFSCRRLGKAGRRKLNEGINAAFRPMQLVSELVWTAHPHRYCTAWMSTGRAKRISSPLGARRLQATHRRSGRSATRANLPGGWPAFAGPGMPDGRAAPAGGTVAWLLDMFITIAGSHGPS